MTNKEIKIAYQEYASLQELGAEDLRLAQAAIDATSQAYAPYSNFNVGAAVMFTDGEIVSGANQENAAYPSGMCAERVALYAAHAALNDAYIQDLAVVGGEGDTLSEEPVCACGACLQVLKEFESQQPVNVLYVGQREVLKIQGVRNLLPFAFTK
jgi:cytidine deaminase